MILTIYLVIFVSLCVTQVTRADEKATGDPLPFISLPIRKVSGFSGGNVTINGNGSKDTSHVKFWTGWNGDDLLDKDDLEFLVKDLESEALNQERVIPEVVELLKGTMMDPNRKKGGDKDNEDLEDVEQEPMLPRDLSDLTEDIADDITAGVEESLRLFDDMPLNRSGEGGDELEMRQMTMYLFQGQYVAEPRLNRFIDGAYRNMGTELRISSMDPLYFRVLPKGRVEEKSQPQNNKVGIGGGGAVGVRRRRPIGGAGVKNVNGLGPIRGKRAMNIPGMQRIRNIIVRRANKGKIVPVAKLNYTVANRKRRQQLIRQRKRKKLLQQQKVKLQNAKKRKQRQKQIKTTNNKNKKVKQLQRTRRRTRQDVGGGRVEGLSRVTRDSDAEMQLFGNYTLIRSHMKIGPVELTMQFRTRNGIRRTGATLAIIRAHTVTRVNHEGSEMVDFLLDRPHPETIRVRGNLFPMAEKIARNIFSRLFLPNSFLTQRMREKAGLALLSKPIDS